MSDEGPNISPEERVRYAKAARQLTGYATFMRWAGTFRRDEVIQHPRHDRVVLLSPLQSGAFAWTIENDSVLLGVQPLEAAWMEHMPFTAAYLSDSHLCLAVDEIALVDAKLPQLAIGIYVDEQRKRRAIAGAKAIQPVHIKVDAGQVVGLGRECGQRIPLHTEDMIAAFAVQAAARMQGVQGVQRYF